MFVADRSIKIWDMATGVIKKNLMGHTRGIACIQFDGNTIVSGSSGEDDPCFTFCTQEPILIVLSQLADKTIKVWDVHTGQNTLTITGHGDLVRTLQFDDVRIVSGSYDETLKVWDRKTGQQVLELKCGGGHTSRVFKLQFDAARVVSCSQDQVGFFVCFGSFGNIRRTGRLTTTFMIYAENHCLGLFNRR